MKVAHLNLGVPIRVSTGFYTVEPGAAGARAARQRAKLEELREYMATEEWASPARPAPASVPVGAKVFKSSQPVASQPAAMTHAESLALAERVLKDLQAKQSEMRLAAAIKGVHERYRNSGRGAR